jgi:hypothetical protein
MNIASVLKQELKNTIEEQKNIENYIKMLKGIHKSSIYLTTNTLLSTDGEDICISGKPSFIRYTELWFSYRNNLLPPSKRIKVKFDLLATDTDKCFQPKYYAKWFFHSPLHNVTITPVPLEDLPIHITMKHIMPAFKKLLSRAGKALQA